MLKMFDVEYRIYSPENSRRWAVHLRYLSLKYGLKDTLECFKSDPPSKSQYKSVKILRTKAENNSLMEYLNVSLTGLVATTKP